VTQHLNIVTAAVRATTFWLTQAPPADFAAGTASAAWTPVNTAITAALAQARNQIERQAVYAQVVGMIGQMDHQLRSGKALSPTDRANAGTYVAQLLIAYAPFVSTGNTV